MTDKQIVPSSALDDLTADSPPPKPMEIFEQRIVHEDNQIRVQALQERLDRFKPLPRAKLAKLMRDGRRLSKRLAKAGVFDQIEVLNVYHDEYVALHDEYIALKAEQTHLLDNNQAVPQDISDRLIAIKRDAKPLKERINVLEQ